MIEASDSSPQFLGTETPLLLSQPRELQIVQIGTSTYLASPSHFLKSDQICQSSSSSAPPLPWG